MVLYRIGLALAQLALASAVHITSDLEGMIQAQGTQRARSGAAEGEQPGSTSEFMDANGINQLKAHEADVAAPGHGQDESIFPQFPTATTFTGTTTTTTFTSENCISAGTCVEFAGRYWKLLDGGDIYGFHGCQESYLPVPSGWEIASAGGYAEQVAAMYPWGTQCLVLGPGIAADTQTHKTCKDRNIPLYKDTSGRYATVCPAKILLSSKFIAGSSCSDMGLCIEVWPVGLRFRTLDLTYFVDQKADHCQKGWLSIPPGWDIARDSPAVRNIIATHDWGTECVYFRGGGMRTHANPFGTCPGEVRFYDEGMRPSDCNAEVLLQQDLPDTTTTVTFTTNTTTTTSAATRR